MKAIFTNSIAAPSMAGPFRTIAAWIPTPTLRFCEPWDRFPGVESR